MKTTNMNYYTVTGIQMLVQVKISVQKVIQDYYVNNVVRISTLNTLMSKINAKNVTKKTYHINSHAYSFDCYAISYFLNIRVKE